jgi:hypothetical protein
MKPDAELTLIDFTVEAGADADMAGLDAGTADCEDCDNECEK